MIKNSGSRRKENIVNASMKNSHGLSHVSQRILRSKQGLLQSLTPNEHPEHCYVACYDKPTWI